MFGIIEQLREKVIAAYPNEENAEIDQVIRPKDKIDNLIALGVLLWVVAQADEQYLPEEKDKIKDVLFTYGKISDADMPIVLRAVEEATINRIDLYAFTREVGNNLSFKTKIGILENLFRIACVDGDLDHKEHEMIRKIARLMRIVHADFIGTKIRIKKEFGLDTAGF